MMEIPESEADWRYAQVARVKGDQVVWGQLVKDRTLLWLTTATEDKRVGRVSFPTPSPVALALSVAVDSARAARALRTQIQFDANGRQSKSIGAGSIGLLYGYFEQSMAAAVFSFQSVEAYANQTIARLVKTSIDVQRRNGIEHLAPDEVERKLSTDEKLTFVLPKVLSVKSPKGTAVWAPYRELKAVRDSTVHLKSADHYVRGRLDCESVYYRLLNQTPLAFPRAAVKMIRHFSSTNPERWLEAAEGRLAQLKAD